MTFRHHAPRAAALAAALVVAACGGSGPTGAPATDAPAPTDGGQPTFALPSFDLGSFEIPSFALPSFNSDAELEAMLPDTIGGTPVVKQSLTGEDFIGLGMGPAGQLDPMLEDLGASVEDLSVAFGSAGTLVVIAYQVEGVAADRIFAGLEAALQAGGEGGQVSQSTVGGRPVTQIVAAGETTYIYLAGDVVFVIGGTVSPELLEDTVSQLPG